MPFHFPLQAVLHLRQSIEHQQELRLHAANQQVARVRQLMLRIDARIQEFRQESSQELELGTRAAVIRFTVALESILDAKRQELEMQLLRVMQIRDQQQKAFEKARQEREKFQLSFERALREYRICKDRRDQKLLDELFLLQRAFRKRG
ncbi:MAG TPA: flagellar FliJ family protein [Terriglobales bacterium]|jgi:flagellar export protein FliJ